MTTTTTATTTVPPAERTTATTAFLVEVERRLAIADCGIVHSTPCRRTDGRAVYPGDDTPCMWAARRDLQEVES